MFSINEDAIAILLHSQYVKLCNCGCAITFSTSKSLANADVVQGGIKFGV